MNPEITLLRDPRTVRARCHALLALGEAGRLPWFSVHPERLEAAAEFVAETTRAQYPDLAIPYHARWRHFAAGGRDRWGALASAIPVQDRLSARIDLCVVSVLLDAGAGAAWHYREPATGQVLARSEGLAVASLDAFRAGLFSSDPARPWQADAEGLARVDAAALARAFQASDANPLDGLEGRAALLCSLGAALCRARPRVAAPCVWELFDTLQEDPLPAASILRAVLDGLSPIWPGRHSIAGENLGDVWPHPLAAPGEPAPGLVPFHKLSQWLAYSLAEVFEEAGVKVVDLDALTGLPEYRNGGLFLDTGVLRLRDPALAAEALDAGHPAVVEWRALTVALLDRVAEGVRARLGLDPAQMPLARVLEGGTWAAGRRLAQERRGGAPPLRIVSDGTVF